MSGPVRSLSQGFAILRIIAAGGRMTLSDIARQADLSPSSTLALLRTLQAEGALERGEGDKRYSLAPGWHELAVLGDGEGQRIRARAADLLPRFAAQHDVTTGLWQVQPGQRLQLVMIGESGSATRIAMTVGQRQPVGMGATGRALCALEGLDRTALERRFRPLRWQRPLPFEHWLAQVEQARHSGFGVDDGFGHAGICSLGTPIPAAPPRFHLSASLFAGTRGDEAITALGHALCHLARQIGGAA
ncbi:IclR family transcriptional regulator [Novosphingobium cyanobacteriorum]|uniref:Helix-turn-helix domain-containing protein n=1 Tax=Novosphingobium cyanobacteriorum TaxID=3024215 RepID=A0ABT6CHG9_9SPHN|nr:helix-turn-helix domain-containing protein [Novosphingobium cyanobacteriorum]MDF8331787.1 helix-turn-helix domain-containing protein [Novosphingobium cyanobacteriorum]